MKMEGKLKITSYNCNGFKSRNYNYIKEIFQKCDILLLQETWLHTFEHKNFSNIVTKCNYHAISAMDETDVQRIGRPYGGVAILWNKNLKLSFIPITTNSNRVCAINIKCDYYNLIIFNVYMPNDNDSNENFDIYGDVLCEISSIINTYEGSDFILGGDFNIDYKRVTSRNLALFKDFLLLEDLHCASFEITDNNFTRMGSLGERSFLDHFIVNKDSEFNIYVDYDGHNLSDHNPINLETSYERKVVEKKSLPFNRLDWANATNDQIINYKNLLNSKLQNFQIPLHILECNDFNCKAHISNILELSEVFMNIIFYSSKIAIGVKEINNKKGIMNWNTIVQPYKDKSIFWYDVWKSAGCPANGQLADLRRFSRNRYHWAIRKARYEENQHILNKTAEQLNDKKFNEFWHTIRKLKGSNKNFASVVDGNTSDNSISSRFRDIYCDLYNSFNDREFSNITKDVDTLINNKCNMGLCSSAHCHDIDSEAVKKAIFKLKANKDDEVYGICTENFINGTHMVFNKLSQLITVMIKHGFASEIINTSFIKPIPKNNKKSLSDSNNYRAISKNTIISKIIDYILIDKSGDKLNTSAYQFAYKAGFSTSMCSFLVAETIQYYKNNGSNVFVLSLDASKAFDLVQYSKLFKLLIERNICPLIIRFLINIYLASSAIVKWNGTQSEPFKISNGVKQGGVISAPLFSIYINPLLDKLQQAKQGCFMGTLCANAFAYADDIVLLTPSCNALRHLINICELFAEEYRLKFNPDKCSLLIYAKTDTEFYYNNCKLFLCGKLIKNVKSEKHLGHTFTTTSHSHILNIESVIKDLKVRTNTIINQFKSISWQAKIKLFLSQCSSLYGCQLWRLDDKQIEELDKTWRICCRRLLGLPPDTRSYVIPSIMGTWPLRHTIMYRILSFFISGLMHDCQNISLFFKNVLISNSSYMLQNVNIILREFDIKYHEIFNMDKIKLKNLIKGIQPNSDWRANIILELLMLRDGQLLCALDTKEVKDILKYVASAR